MVADGGDIVAHVIHHIDDVFALGQRADGIALNRIAAVRQQHGIARLFKGLLVCGKTRIADVVRVAAMDVVGVEYDDGAMLRRGFLRDRGEAQKHGKNQKQCKKFFHDVTRPSFFSG